MLCGHAVAARSERKNSLGHGLDLLRRETNERIAPSRVDLPKPRWPRRGFLFVVASQYREGLSHWRSGERRQVLAVSPVDLGKLAPGSV
jgi:hypothetical protein